MRRVVITGLGAVTAYGVGKDVLWSSLKAGKSGIKPIERFDASPYTTRFAGEVYDFDPEEHIEPAEARRMARFTQFGVVAAESALADAAFEIAPEEAHRVGVIVGSGVGGLEVMEEAYRLVMEKGPRRMSPLMVPMMIPDLAAGHISIRSGAKGPNFAPASACATSNHSVGEAFETIRRGAADVVLAGGCEACVTILGLGGFCAARALSTRNDEPTRASRPFDKGRDGFVMAEGAGVAVLETLDHAEARGAHIYAEVIGYGASADAYHITAPDPTGEGARWAMREAMAEAGVAPEEVDYVNAHGTSTPIGDTAEVAAVKEVFGDHAYELTMSSTKSMTGHLLGAAGAVELVACAMALEEGICPPTVNLDEPDEGMDLDFAPNVAKERPVSVAISNSFGFGGHNATLVLSRLDR
jgi:3-oxoacyl-[acyl-carrier-protein] synthase II